MPAYETAVEVYGILTRMERTLVRHDPMLAERLRISSVSISVSIAAGAAATRRSRKLRRYRAAIYAATDCSALLDLFIAGGKCDDRLKHCKQLLERIGTELTPLILSMRGPEGTREGK